ncbi:MAG: hypothetical protein AAF551_00160, partial [Bacteroidota bacterium]
MEIDKTNRTDLKGFFLKNLRPTEAQFAEFIDSTLNQAEDGIVKEQGSPLALQAEGDSVSTQEVLNVFSNFLDDAPQWSINLKPRVDPSNPDSNQPGLNIKDARGESRLFIRASDGNIGLGSIEPEAGLTIKGKDNEPVIAVISDRQHHTHAFEVALPEGDGQVSVRGKDATEVVRLSGAKEGSSFFMGKVGVGTDDPLTHLHVSGEAPELRISGT